MGVDKAKANIETRSRLNSLYHTLKEKLTPLSAEEGLRLLGHEFASEQIRFSTALGEEDQVITQIIGANKLPITIFTLDTGRLFQETYELIDLTRSKYKIGIKVHFPDREDIENLVDQKGVNSFYASVENRKECCFIRKVKPLKKALKGATIWITGLRASQSSHRQSFNVVEWDEDLQMVKYNPILHWSYDEMQQYIMVNRIPVNSLHKKGFASIGCAPCTRAIMPGEDIRAGRWWWEDSHKECGLHAAKAVAK